MEDEAAEGVWGYLISLDSNVHDALLVLRKRDSCEGPRDSLPKSKSEKDKQQNKDSYEGQKKAHPPGGYFVGRHPECGR